MKATELKIGDCVAYKGKPARIQALDSPIIYVAMDADGDILGIPEAAGDISPIPLTEETLERNGWHRQASHGETQGWSNGHAKLYPQDRKFGGGFMFLYSGNAVQYVHHVHQLQHILWALGMDDDLKI